jgi:hypothetical protein
MPQISSWFVFMVMRTGSGDPPLLVAGLFANSWVIHRVDYEVAEGYFDYCVEYTGYARDEFAARTALGNFYEEAYEQGIVSEYVIVDERENVYELLLNSDNNMNSNNNNNNNNENNNNSNNNNENNNNSNNNNSNNNSNNNNAKHIRIPNNTEDAITMNTIEEGNKMVNFHGERKLGRYYKKSTFNSLKRKNPYTRRKIRPANRTNYIATFKGGKRRRETRRH